MRIVTPREEGFLGMIWDDDRDISTELETASQHAMPGGEGTQHPEEDHAPLLERMH